MFLDLHAERGAGFSAPNPITSACMLAWEQLNRTRLTAWEQSAIRAIDRVFLEHVAAQQQQQQPQRHTKPPPGH